MGHTRGGSSESDEEANVRHDRFKSERHQDSSSSRHNTSSTRAREDIYDRSSRSKKYRDRSPLRSHKRKSESSSYRKESRGKYNDIGSNSHSSKYDKRREKSQSSIEKKNTDGNEKVKQLDEPNLKKTNSIKLSSLLLNFDKQLESKRINSENPPTIGPALPPHLVQKIEAQEKNSIGESGDNLSIGPALPPNSTNSINNSESESDNESHVIQNSKCIGVHSVLKNDKNQENADHCSDSDSSTMGPAVLPLLQSQQISINKTPEEIEIKVQKDPDLQSRLLSPSCHSDEKLGAYGPALPAPKKLESDSYGPALPPNLKKESIQGPTLPSGMTAEDLERMGQVESEDEDTVGPLPEGKMSMVQYQLDLRAMDIKRKLEEEKSGSSKDIKRREEWMLELPPEKASNLGLGPRSFRMREGPDMSNRSAWTDTPAEKKRKEEMALRGESEPVNSDEIMRSALVEERNKTMDKISKLSKDEKRQESLLEQHQKKMKKKKKKEEKEGKKKERRPFDRNIDLQVHRFDEAQKKAIFKKAQLLDSRFSTGESKYL